MTTQFNNTPRQTAHLDRWFLNDVPEGVTLIGIVTGHPHFADGTRVRTSLVQKLDEATNTAATLNTDYILSNQIDPDQ